MKRNTIASFAATLLFALSVPCVFAQYGSEACAPSCEIPTATYAPTCDVPTCEAPTCDVPTCEAPTCDVPSCAPTCDVSCGTSFGCAAGYCDSGCYSGCGCCFDLCGLVTGTLNVAVSPFKWVYCELTDGIFPDCGCAPRPPKTACNPCTICGDYAGGCNDNCEYGACGSCGDCGNGYYAQNQSAYADSYASGTYSSAVYDVEQYDASPTRGGKAVPTLPINGGYNNSLSAAQRVRNFNVQRVANVQRKATNISSVSYEQNAQAQKVRPIQANVPAQRPMPQTKSMNQKPNVKTPVMQKAQNARSMQNKQNVRIVSENAASTESSTGKTFGRTRPIE